jgi:hypothetical protein
MRLSTWSIVLIIYSVSIYQIKRLRFILKYLWSYPIYWWTEKGQTGQLVTNKTAKLYFWKNTTLISTGIRSTRRIYIIKCCGVKRCLPGLRSSTRNSSSTSRTTTVKYIPPACASVDNIISFLIAPGKSLSTAKSCHFNGQCCYN